MAEEEWITATQETLGKLIAKPKMTEKYLKKPPFRFLHDAIMEVTRATTFGTGLFTPEESEAASLADKQAKIDFLNKAINVTCFAIGEKIDVSANKIVAGLEAEKTNAWLQKLATAASSCQGAKSDEAVQRVLNGETLAAPKKSREKKEKKEDKKAEEDPAAAPPAEAGGDDGAAAAAEDPDKAKKEKDEKRRAERKRREEKKKKEEEEAAAAAAPAGGDADAPPAAEDAPPPEDAPKKRDKKDKEKERKEKEDLKRQQREQREEEDRRRQEEEENRRRLEEQQAQAEAAERERQAYEEEARRQQEAAQQAEASPSPSLPGTAGQPNRPMDDQEGFPQEGEEDPNGMARPLRMERPRTAGRKPPKVVSKVKSTTDDPGLTANIAPPTIIAEGAANDDEEDMFEPAAGSVPANSIARNAGDGAQHGKLVRDLLAEEEKQKEKDRLRKVEESTREAVEDNREKGIVMGKLKRKKETASNFTEVDVAKLGDAIQHLCQAANPLGKSIDLVHQDISNMGKELDKWKQEYREASEQYQNELKLTEEHLQPLHQKIAELDDRIAEQKSKIRNSRSRISKNDQKIQSLLESVVMAK